MPDEVVNTLYISKKVPSVIMIMKRIVQSKVQNTSLNNKQNHQERDGWIDDLQFYVLFNSILIASERRADNNERLYAMEPRLRLRRFRLERGSNPLR